MKQLWNRLLWALVPSFGADQHGRALEFTFRLLTHLIKVLVALVAIWAIAAGFLQTGRLIKFISGGLPGHGTGFWVDQANWLGPLLGVPVYALKAFGVTMLVGLAAAMVGGVLGFLFGVPRLTGETAMQSATTAVAGSGSPVPPSPAAGTSAPSPPPRQAQRVASPSGEPAAAAGLATLRGRRGWQASTNLTEISDWLTKIIVGVGLVEAKGIYQSLSELSGSLGRMLFDGAAGSLLVVPAVIVSGVLLGFLYAYLFTQLVVAELVAHTDAELSNAGGISPSQGTVLPPDIQDRKLVFSSYIQSLVSEGSRDLLDRVAHELEVPTDPDLRTERGNILAAVGEKVDVADAATAAAAMTELSNKLRAITDRDF